LGLLFKEISFGISLNYEARTMHHSALMRRQGVVRQGQAACNALETL